MSRSSREHDPATSLRTPLAEAMADEEFQAWLDSMWDVGHEPDYPDEDFEEERS